MTNPNSRYDDRATGPADDGMADVSEELDKADNHSGDRVVAPGGTTDWSQTIDANPSRLGGPQMAPGLNSGPDGRMTLAEWKEEQKAERVRTGVHPSVRDEIMQARREAKSTNSLDDVEPVDGTGEPEYELADLEPEDIFG
ncbi:hypothetical protein [Haloferax gibbonsii]|uniref:hypothetical protein n=1 Tax=Haloferax gibbonsii TaxID=35746 RepID=UPI000B04E3F7|nr:hypothetical protein [Haloferax gibbonsii]